LREESSPEEHQRRLNKKQIIKILVGVLVGAAAGFLICRFNGCTSGACPLARNFYVSTLYGAALGGLISHMF
jgi:hypothetical protein